MKLGFTKMQGAGNDFVVLDATREPRVETLTTEQFRRLADRRFGIGADQILVVAPSRTPGVDFRYRIFNASGGEVEHCGNGARCFLQFVRDKGLTTARALRVETINRVIGLQLQADGRVTVDMGAPVFDTAQVPFDATGLVPREVAGMALWPLDLAAPGAAPQRVEMAVLSMGNPHAVTCVEHVDAAPVAMLGPLIEHDARFPRGVNAGFMQITGRGRIRLRVHERGAGETPACGSGACAAVVAGIRLGALDARVDVEARGGLLTVEWAGGSAPVFMTGPAATVYEGEIEL